MLLGLIVLAGRVVLLGLMMVMRGGVVVAGRRVMMLLRRMLRHVSAPLLPIAADRRSVVRHVSAD
jgi:hypothetical protein